MKSGISLRDAAKHQKKWYAKWHVYFGLLAGSFIFIMSLTGAILSFRYEIDRALNPELFNISGNGKFLTPGQIIEKVEKVHRNWKIIFLDASNRELNWPYTLIRKDSEDYIYVNPYSGEITGVRDYHKCFIGVVEHIHRYLLVDDAGKYVTGISSLALAILLVTGLRMWIPKQLKHLRARLTIDFSAGIKRLNWDIHNTLGFYFSPVIILIALTGFILTFARYVIPLFLLLSFEKPKSLDKILKQHSVFQKYVIPVSPDSAVASALAVVPDGRFARVALPEDSAGVYTVRIIGKNELRTGDLIQLAVDQYSGKIVFNSDTDVPELTKVYTNWIGPLHFGTLGGFTTQLINLLASLVTALLFVTGLIIWLGRGKKIRKEKSKSGGKVKALKRIQEEVQ
jgi:uncharacterized iron-regulated membrane protein